MAIAAKNSSALQWLCPLMRPSEATMETAFEEVTEEQREEPRKCFHVKVSIWFTDIYSTDVLDVSKANVVLVPTDVGGEALFEEFRWHFSGEKQRRRLERFRASSQSGSLIALCSPSKTHTVNTKMLTHTNRISKSQMTNQLTSWFRYLWQLFLLGSNQYQLFLEAFW